MKNFLFDFKEGILISLAAIKANKMRSFLTTIGIFIGIVAVTTMSTAIIGLKASFMNSLSSIIAQDVVYIDKFKWNSNIDWRVYRNRKNITYSQYEKFIAKYGEKAVAISPIYERYGVNATYKDKSVTTTFFDGGNTNLAIIKDLSPETGRFLNETDVKAGRNVCIIGSDIAEGLFEREEPLGKFIKVRGTKLKVIGVLPKKGSSFFGMPSPDGQIVVPFKVSQKMFGSRRSVDIAVKVKDAKNMEIAKEEIQHTMRVVRKNQPGKPDDFALNTQDVGTQQYDSTIGVIATAGIVITLLSLFVGAIGIMNIMFVSVTERTREIGIRKAIGAKTWTILIQFLSEAAFICLLGGILGVFVSYLLSLAISNVMPASMPVGVVVMALFISIVVGIISGFMPAYKASKLEPVEALRYE